MEEKKYYKVRKLLKMKYIIIGLIIILFIGTNIVSIEDTVSMRIVVTALGIDYNDENYLLSGQIFIPSTDKSKFQPKQIIDGKGKSVNEAIENMIANTGRFGNISHCKIIILGKSVTENDVSVALNHFVNNETLGWSTMVATTDGDAKKLLEGINKLEKDIDFAWQNYMEPDRQNGDTVATDLREFLNNAASKSQCVLTNILNISEAKADAPDIKEGGGNEGQGNQGSGQGEGGGFQEQQKETISLENSDSAIIKNGKRICTLTKEQTRGYNLLEKRNNIQMQYIDVEKYLEPADINREDAESGRYKMSLKMERKKVRLRFSFKDGVPTASVKIKAVYEKYEDGSNGFKPLLPSERDRLRRQCIDAIKKKMTEQFYSAFDVAKENDADFFQFAERFRQANRKQYENLANHKTSKEFLESIKFDFNLQIRVEM